MNGYVFSWYAKARVPVITHPKWWQVWKRAELVMVERWQRTALTGLTKPEADMLQQIDWASAQGMLLARLMGRTPCQVQLEQQHGGLYLNPSEYIDTGPRTNYMCHSEPTEGKPWPL